MFGGIWIAARTTTRKSVTCADIVARNIGNYGSITQAAKAVGISYKTAWDAVDVMNNLSGDVLVESATGGKGGGGTQLTAAGKN